MKIGIKRYILTVVWFKNYWLGTKYPKAKFQIGSKFSKNEQRGALRLFVGYYVLRIDLYKPLKLLKRRTIKLKKKII